MGSTMNAEIEIANVEQAAAWDGHEGDSWTENADRYDRATTRHWRHVVEARLIGPSDDVIDVGCGTGKSTRDIARMAAQGSVFGLDLSARMLELARQRSEAEGLTNVTFVQGDAQVFPFEPQSCDLAYSNFGAMFFGDPVAAFTNIARAVRPGGRLALMVWRELSRNEWLTLVREALAVGRELGTPPPDAPTPFALADPDRVRGILSSAGFHNAEFTAVDEPVDFGPDLAEAWAFAQTMGIVEGLTNGLSDDDRALAMSQLHAMLAAHETPTGVLLGTSAWLITALRV